ncbi:MAG: transposase, partial [Rhodoferax sp.]|nr:transposase [Rhodoferax sp.]
QLYAVEAKAKENELDTNKLLEQRQLHSVPVLNKIEALLLANLHAMLPGSLLGKALHYLSSQWPKLTLYVTHGAYPIDNNACENSIRPFVIGRRNWLFADTVAGANASANLYSLLQTCAANGVDGYGYLRALLVALPKAQTVDDYEALLPWAIAMSADRLGAGRLHPESPSPFVGSDKGGVN